jgi:hypothetical protein
MITGNGWVIFTDSPCCKLYKDKWKSVHDVQYIRTSI